MSTWLPIESAPRDKGYLLGLLASGRVCTIAPRRSNIFEPDGKGAFRVARVEDKGWNEIDGDAIVPRTFSHWMPLSEPPPPAQEEPTL